MIKAAQNQWNRMTQEDKLCWIGLVFLTCGAAALFVYLKWLEPMRGLPGCVFYRLFYVYCPGCGGTRALLALLRGDLITSVCYHPVVLYGAVVFGWFLLSHLLERLHVPGVHGARYHDWYFYVALALLALNCIVRNVLKFGFGILLT